MPKIVINGRFLTAKPTGVQRMARELVLAIDDVLSQTSAHEEWALYTPEGAADLPLNVIRQHVVGPLTGNLWEQFSLPKAARKACLLNLCNMGPVFHGRSVVTIHDAQVYLSPESYSLFFRSWYRTIQPILASKARRLASVSEFSKRQMLFAGLGSEEKINVIHNGVDHILKVTPDLSVLDTYQLTPKRYFLAFSSPQRHKNTSMLLDAYGALPQKTFPLLLVGGALPEETVLDKGVIHVPGISDEALLALYQEAGLFLFPSMTEGFGLPPGEAWMAGCPVAMAKAGAMPEVYPQAPLMLDPENAQAWTDVMHHMQEDSSYRESLLTHRDATIAGLRWNDAAQSYINMMTELSRSTR